ncbi:MULTISPECIES: phage integrase N-terminal domain-containing protein [Acinetobacter]|uniref:phage integrase N-terminal domain-containing protein n=1 Tax=Acinetobacter TaxID=469 RepID=UPI0012E2DE88|nr:phage integrase N-terminal domain-containing protein [Acinetobacter baumannii]HAV4234770.1 integrase [Acinetobacter baumannii ATCC 17978]MUQ07896.1 integrase [Acinetobacter baumannii]MUQ15892.1 integrase [Acinetobacter baumannii]MUQ19301.1 integrase [Acinetobacter baumannii]MUQ83126.1 integrase [Acinetobacter baumannii]
MALEYQLKQLCDKFREGSHATQANRRSMLNLFAKQLAANGYNIKNMSAYDLKGRYVNKLIQQWRKDGASTGTIKNRMAVLRWWAKKINNSGAVKDGNDSYLIEKRVYVTNENKSVSLRDLDLSKIDTNIAQSLRLQDAFGLRREESMKFQPKFALDGQTIDNAKYIRLKASWTKGGRPRTIPITNEKQRQELRNAYAQAIKNGGSLVPKEKTYKAHLASFEAVTHALGIGQTHGLRHGYAQTRYRELMGFDCPAVGGVRKLTAEERAKDNEIRYLISEELGHNRTSITSVYLGSWSKK